MFSSRQLAKASSSLAIKPFDPNKEYKLKVGFRISNHYLGRGASGCVNLGSLKSDSKQYAFKKIPIVDKTVVEKEIDIMATLTALNHDYFVNLKGYLFIKEMAYICMDYASGGSLANHLNKLNLSQQATIMLKTAKGVDMMHGIHITHNDLKAENILIEIAEDGNIVSKICDFDSSTRGGIDPPERVGTSTFYSPELFDTGAVNTSQSDVYAMTMTFGQMLARLNTKELQERIKGCLNGTPFQNYISSGQRIPCDASEPWHPKLAKLITWGWATNPNERPTANNMAQELERIMPSFDS